MNILTVMILFCPIQDCDIGIPSILEVKTFVKYKLFSYFIIKVLFQQGITYSLSFMSL
jgi:hypothetical protein